MREGWICPSCRKGVRPDMTHCDHPGQLAQGMPSMQRPMQGVGIGMPSIGEALGGSPYQFPQNYGERA